MLTHIANVDAKRRVSHERPNTYYVSGKEACENWHWPLSFLRRQGIGVLCIREIISNVNGQI